MSFGKQEPPKANPGLRYAAEIFNFVSLTTAFITSWLSTPIALQSNPNSFAKLIFVACQALLAYLTASAAQIDITWGATENFAWICISRRSVRGSSLTPNT